MTLQDELVAAKARLETAAKAKLKAEAVHDQAVETLSKITEELKNKYGVETVEDAKLLLATLQGEVRGKLKSVIEALDKLEK